MASGILGSADLAATTDTTIYTVPVSMRATVSVNICNRNSGKVDIRLAIVDTVLDNGDYLEYDLTLDGNSPIERTGIILGAGQFVVAYSDTANVSVNVYGFEGPE